jgi:hypothetical protein
VVVAVAVVTVTGLDVIIEPSVFTEVVFITMETDPVAVIADEAVEVCVDVSVVTVVTVL